jgi:hypothetical protein
MIKCENCGNALSKGVYKNKLINFCKECGYGLPDEEGGIINLINCTFCNKWFYKEKEKTCKCRQLTE